MASVDLGRVVGPAGADGTDGKDATINGRSTINIVEGDNVTIEQSGDTLTINATGGSGGGGIDDAPLDGKQYGRQNAEWTEVKASSGGEIISNIEAAVVENGINLADGYRYFVAEPVTSVDIESAVGKGSLRFTAANNFTLQANVDKVILTGSSSIVSGMTYDINYLDGVCHISEGFSLPVKPLKVLLISNSFGQDAASYVDRMSRAANVHTIYAVAYIGGATMQQHYNNMNSGSNRYTLYVKDSVNGNSTVSSQSIQKCIEYADWDIITFQSQSAQAGLYDRNAPYLQPLLDFSKLHCSNKEVRFMWHMTWAYSSTYNNSSANWDPYDHSQVRMFELIAETSQRILTNFADIVDIIPCGTAIQNCRTSSTLFALDAELTADGYHLATNSGDVIASYTLLCKTAGIPVTQVDFATAGLPSAWTSEYDTIARECIAEALDKMYVITDYVDPEPPVETLVEFTDYTKVQGFCSEWDSSGLTMGFAFLEDTTPMQRSDVYTDSLMTPTTIGPSSAFSTFVAGFSCSRNAISLPAGSKVIISGSDTIVRFCSGTSAIQGAREVNPVTGAREIELTQDSLVVVNLTVPYTTYQEESVLDAYVSARVKLMVPESKISLAKNNEAPVDPPVDPPVDEYTVWEDFTVLQGFCATWSSAMVMHTLEEAARTNVFTFNLAGGPTNPATTSHGTNTAFVANFLSSKRALFLPAGSIIDFINPASSIRYCNGASMGSGARDGVATNGERTIELTTDRYVMCNLTSKRDVYETDASALKAQWLENIRIRVPTEKLSQANNNEV